MIISENKKFIFIHIPKTGGMSIRKCLQKYATTPIYAHNCKNLGVQNNNLLEKHASAKTIRDFIGVDKWNEYFKFAFVRNPLDWIVSVYFYILKDKSDPRHIAVKKFNFKEFVMWFLHINPIIYPARRGQYNYISDENKLIIDFVGKFENFEKDFHHVCKKINIPYEVIPHLNDTTHDSYYKYYDEETKKLIQYTFKIDTIYFGYK